MFTEQFLLDPLFRSRKLFYAVYIFIGLPIFFGSPYSALAETEPPLKELPRATFRTSPPIYKEWNFEKGKEGSVPALFKAHTVGGPTTDNWEITSISGAPSGTHTVVQSATCPQLSCIHVLLANDIDLQYVDLAVRLRKQSDMPGSGGVIFAAKDEKNFYGVLFDPQAKLMQAIRVLDGKISVMAEENFEPEDVDWHLLRIQRRTIVSRDFVNIHLDHHRILSVSGSELQSGSVGVVTTGQSPYAFDNLRAIEIITGRPLSRPPAY
ncbi:MAG: hypothetical protein GKS05_07755 [Nitrospirales bacterium]|nr:hypothetical protein [Nitrospirales bacterium]